MAATSRPPTFTWYSPARTAPGVRTWPAGCRVPDVGQADAAADGLAPGAGGHLAIALIGAIYYLVVGRTKAFAPIVTPAEDDAPLAGSGAPLAPGGTTPPTPALAELARRGLVTRTVSRHGGTVVAAPKLEQDLTTLAGFSEQLRRHGMVAGARVLSARSRPAGPAAAPALEIAG